MKFRPRAQHASLFLTVALIAIVLLLFVLQPPWVALARWQARADFKMMSGYLLVILMICMWLPNVLRRWLREPAQLELIKLSHQWLGIVLLLLFVFHANVARSGFLAVQTVFLLTLCGLGAGVVWTQITGRTQGRHAMMVTHVALAFAVCGFALLHLYFIYAYAA